MKLLKALHVVLLPLWWLQPFRSTAAFYDVGFGQLVSLWEVWGVVLDMLGRLEGLVHTRYQLLPLRVHRYQLIYAHGSHIELPGEQARARAIQALLHILSCQGHKPSTPIGATLVREGVAVWAAGGASTKPGAFSGLRLLPGAALDSALPMLCCQLAEALMQDPPYALRWMQGHPAKVAYLGRVFP